MTDLYIANGTPQNHVFRYITPEAKTHSMLSIPAGKQIVLKGLTTADVKAIVEPYERYGMIDVSSVDREKSFSGMCYSTDKPVTGSKLTHAVESRKGALAKAGEELRKVTAMANAKKAEEIAASDNIKLNAMDVEVEEEEDDGTPGKLVDTVNFVQEGDSESPKNRRGRGRPRKNA